MLGVIDDLDDAALMTNAAVLVGFLNPEQHAVADTGRFARVRSAWNGDTDLRRGSMRVLVPFVGRSDEITVAVTRRNVSEHGRGQCPRMMQLFPPFLDGAFVGQFAKQALELRTQRVFQPECARDFAGADFSGLVADEGEDVGFGREGGCSFGFLIQNRQSCAKTALIDQM